MINPQLQEELNMNQAASSGWEKLFRIGVYYILFASIVGAVAERIFGKATMSAWMWVWIIPYILFSVYCSNYAVCRFVKNTVIKIAWFGVMGFLLILSTLSVLFALASGPATQP